MQYPEAKQILSDYDVSDYDNAKEVQRELVDSAQIAAEALVKVTRENNLFAEAMRVVYGTEMQEETAKIAKFKVKMLNDLQAVATELRGVK